MTCLIFFLVIAHYQPALGYLNVQNLAKDWIIPSANELSECILSGPLYSKDCSIITANETIFDNGIQFNLTKVKKHEDMTITVTTCENVTILSSDEKRLLSNNLIMMSFTGDYVILSWADVPNKNKMKIAVFNMATCKIQFTIGTDEIYSLVLNKDTFEVIVDNLRLTYDINGRIKHDPVQYPVDFEKCHPYCLSRTLYLKPDDYFVHIALTINYLGLVENETCLWTKTINFGYLATSDAHQLSGFCATSPVHNIAQFMNEYYSTIYCAQFDADHNIELDVAYDLPELVQWLAVHNLAGGGFLLATGGCQSDLSDCQSFRIWRVYPDGLMTKIGPVGSVIRLRYCHRKGFLITRVTETNNSNEFRFEFGCLTIDEYLGRLEMIVQCPEMTSCQVTKIMYR